MPLHLQPLPAALSGPGVPIVPGHIRRIARRLEKLADLAGLLDNAEWTAERRLTEALVELLAQRIQREAPRGSEEWAAAEAVLNPVDELEAA